MKWRKRGLIYAPSGAQSWALNYAHVPTAELVNASTIRVYFSALDQHKFGRIGWVDLDAAQPERIMDIGSEPLLDLGELGTFDDSGVVPTCTVNWKQRVLLYYFGFQRAERVPYLLFAGLAIKDTNTGQFIRNSRTPVLDRTPSEPFIRSAMSVLVEGDHLRSWYVSGINWTSVSGAQYPSYVIRHAESCDGIDWLSSEGICIGFKDEDEFGFGRPWVVRDPDCYRMWYSIRSRSRPYCIGYAESSDGLNWIRKDDCVGLEVSKSGWDSEMICYPCVVDVNDERLMFYNGNRHGSSGFGYAVLER